MSPIRIVKKGQPITTLSDWFRLAPPEKGALQWKDGRSAKELARRWLGASVMPEEVHATLDLHPDTRDFLPEQGKPEHRTRLDRFRRPRQHDLVVMGRIRETRALICIEGKCDEEFGDLVKDVLGTLPPSGRPERVTNLLRALFGTTKPELYGRLRYQLVHAVAGTVIEAKKRSAPIAIFLVHELLTDSCRANDLRRNASDLDRFLQALGDEPSNGPSFVTGPITIPGWNEVPPWTRLYLARATVDLRAVG